MTTVNPNPINPIANPSLVVEASSKNFLTVIFSYTIEPFITLITKVVEGIATCAFAITNFTYQSCYSLKVIFSRLIFSPVFHPLEPSFKEVTLANFVKKEKEFIKQIQLFDQKFNNPSLIVQEMKDLKELSSEIHSIYTKLQSYQSILASRVTELPIETDIKQVLDLYQHLNDQLEFSFNQNGMKILNQFQGIQEIFLNGGVDLPPGLQKDLTSTWGCLKEAFVNHLTQLDPCIQTLFAEIEKKMVPIEKKDSSGKHPLKLSTAGNSCYLASILQSFVCVDHFCNELEKPLLWDPKKFNNLKQYQGLIDIQDELRQFFNVQKMNREASNNKYKIDLQFILSLLNGPSIARLRQKIFKSKLSLDLSHMGQLYNQQDAACVAELLLEYLPKCHIQLNQTKTTAAFPGLEFKMELPKETTFKVALEEKGNFEDEASDEICRDHFASEDEWKALIEKAVEEKNAQFNEKNRIQNLIEKVMNEHVSDQTQFDPKNGIVVDPISGAKSQAEPSKIVDEYNKTLKFRELPEILTLHMIRWTNTLKKNDAPVSFPDNGIIDLSPYASEKAKYKVKSYVVHQGATTNSGHYIAYVEIDGKYFLCNDMNSDPYQEVSRDDFLGLVKDAYIVVLVKT